MSISLKVSSCQEEQQLLDLTTSEVRTSFSRALECINNFCSKNEAKKSELSNSTEHLVPDNASFMSFCRRNKLWKRVLEALLSSGGAPLSRITLFLIRELEESFVNDLEYENKSKGGGKDKDSGTNDFCIDELLEPPKEIPVTRRTDKRKEFLDTFRDVGFVLDDILDEPVFKVEKQPYAKKEKKANRRDDIEDDEEPVEGSVEKVEGEDDSTETEGSDKVDPNKMHTCPECNYQSNYEAMRQHLKKALGGRRRARKCGECDYESKYEACFKTHLRIHRKAEHFCPRCDFVGKNGKELDRHLLNHILDLDPNVFRCPKCKYTTKSKKLLIKHKIKHKHRAKRRLRKPSGKTYKCSHCEFVAIKKKELTMHLRRKHLPHIKCDQCSYACHTVDALKRHAITHTDERPYPCRFCQYKSKTKTELRRHEMKHSDVKQYQCSVCDYSTNKSSSLRSHMLDHSGDHLYKCHLCPYGTNVNESRLKSHMRTHSTEKEFKCTEFGCNYETRFKSQLKMHISVHTGEKRYYCHHYGCLYGTNYRKDLNSHIVKTHGGEKLYKCQYCDHATNLKANYLLHKKHCEAAGSESMRTQPTHQEKIQEQHRQHQQLKLQQQQELRKQHELMKQQQQQQQQQQPQQQPQQQQQQQQTHEQLKQHDQQLPTFPREQPPQMPLPAHMRQQGSVPNYTSNERTFLEPYAPLASLIYGGGAGYRN